MILFSCKGQDPLTTSKVDGALGPKYPDLVLSSLTPIDGQTGVPLKPNIILNFNTSVDPLTLTVNLNNSICSGSVQVSKNNFVNCEQLVPPIASPGNYSFTISPVFDLAELTNYKIKVTNKIVDTVGKVLSNPQTSNFKTLDSTAPIINAIFPPEDTVEVNQNTGITLFFSEQMDANSITTNFSGTNCSGTFQVSKDSFFTCIAMLPPYTLDGKSFSSNPIYPLDSLETYQIRALTQIKDLWGNNLANEFISKGFKVKDWTPPVVKSTIPVQAATDVSYYTLISTTFSKRIDSTTIKAIESGNSCTESFQLSKDNFLTCLPLDPAIVSANQMSFSLKPKTPLGPETSYKFKFTTAVKDSSGINLATPYIGSFTTTPLPEVISTVPLAGEVQVPATTTVSVTFSKSMDASSVYSNSNSSDCNIGTFNIAKQSDPDTCIPLGPVTTNASSTIFTAKPVLNLDNSETYIIKVSHLVRDNSGNELASNFVLLPGFRIYDTTPPVLSESDITRDPEGFVPSNTIILNFDESMNPESMGGLYTGSTRTSCVGTIQLSNDSFLTCLPFTQSTPIASNNNRSFEVKPLGDLSLSTNYKLKVTTAAQDIYGNNILEPIIINFKTLNPVMVGATFPPNSISPLVPKNSNIQISFNRPVLNSSISFMTSPSTGCSGSIQVSEDDFITCILFLPQALPGTQNQVITLNPASELDNFTNYKIRVLQTVEDINNISMASTYTQTIGFKTIDTIPPYVASTTPDNNTTLAARNTSLSVNFDEGMDPTTISTNASNTACSGSLQVSKDNFSTCVQMTGQPIQDPQGMVWTMQPVSILDNFTFYKFRVLAGVKDTQGNAMATTYDQTPGFQTIDDIPPVLLSSSPASGTVGVPANSNIVLTFSEAMSLSSITTTNSSICGSSTVQLQVGPSFSSCVPILSNSPSSGNTVFTIVPGNSLGNTGTLYNLKISNLVQDSNGNQLPATLNIPFRATDTVVPSVASYSPSNGSRSSIGSTLLVNFSEEVRPSSLITNQGSDSSCTGKTWYAQVGTNCLLMNPFTASADNISFSMSSQSLFPRNSTVNVTIKNVVDIQGNVQASPTTYSFTTDDPGQASLVVPTNGATEVLTNSLIQVGFDRTMDASTLTLNNSGNNCSGNIQVSSNDFVTCVQFTSNLANPIGGGIYELIPTTSLSLSSTYTVRVGTGAETTAGDSWPVNQNFSFTTVNPPTITAINPANEATNTARSSNIDFTFSKAMLISSITTNSTNTNCWGTVQVSTDNVFSSCLQMTGPPTALGSNVFRVDPINTLPDESMVYFRVTTGVFDTVGQNMLANFNSSFKTRDEIQPSVASTVPLNLATNVINDATMTVTFSEPMTATSVTVTNTSGSCSGTVQMSSNAFTSCLGLSSLGLSATDTLFTFKPISNLPNASTISARVLSTVKDKAGNGMAANYAWSFTSNTVPNISSITPASSATFVPVSTNIAVQFNKQMNPLTFTNNTASDCSNGNILFSTDSNFLNCQAILTQTFNASNTTATFTVFNPLSELTTYYFKIKNSISDVDGMKPVSDFNSSFTTGDSSPPSVSSTNPAAGATNAAENLISITFSEQMATSTITSGLSNCSTGNIQVSSDNFANCAPLGSATTSDNLTFNFVPSPFLSPLQSYQIKVKQAVTDRSGNSMSSDYVMVPAFTVKDYVPPTIASSSPIPATSNVATDASVTVTFSETMNTTTVSSNGTTSCDANAGFLFSNNNFTSCLPVSSPFTADQITFNFVPLNGLYNGVNYQYKINTSVKDSAGNNLVTAYTSNFTVNDTTANTVTMTAPTNGASGVPFGAGAQQFSIRFTATVNSADVTTNLSSTSCTGNVQLSSDNFVTCAKWSSAPTTTDNLNYNLGGVAENLRSNTNYLLKVSRNISTTAAGKSIKKDYIFNFITDVEPTVISLTPAQGATDTATFGPNTIAVTFDTMMDSSTVVGTADNSCGNTGVDLSVNSFVNCLPLTSTSTDFRTFYLTPTSALTNNTRYKVRITPKAESSEGNPMVGYYPNQSGQSFTTTNKPTVSFTSPSNGATGVSRTPTLQINFSEPMVNVTTNNSSFPSGCSGTVQLSSNNFGSCVGLRSPTTSGNTNFSILLGTFSSLTTNTAYQLKILGTVAAVRQNIPMGSDYIISFTTSATSALAISILDKNLNCEEESAPKSQGIPSTKITWEKSKETLVNSPEGGYEVYYQKDDTNLYCKKIPYINGEWAANETFLSLDKGLWKIRVKSYSRLNPQGSAPSEIKEVIVP